MLEVNRSLSSGWWFVSLLLADGRNPQAKAETVTQKSWQAFAIAARTQRTVL